MSKNSLTETSKLLTRLSGSIELVINAEKGTEEIEPVEMDLLRGATDYRRNK